MSESPTVDRSLRMEQKIARVRKATNTLAIVTSPAFIQVERISTSQPIEKDTMATQADIDAFWDKAANRLKPHFEAVTANTNSHTDAELAPIKLTLADFGKALGELSPMKVTLADHGKTLDTIVDSLANVQIALDEIRKKIG